MVAMPNRYGFVSPVLHPHQEQGDLWHNIMCVHTYLNSGRPKPWKYFCHGLFHIIHFVPDRWNRSW